MTAPLDLDAVHAAERAAWSAGNYAVVGTTLQIVGEMLCEALDLRAGSRVLDVAAGNGSASLAAARRWCDVTSTDYVEAWLESGRRRADAEGHLIDFATADAERLPYPDGAFDVVMSSFGVMFALEHERAAAELARVCRRGGKIGLASWTPDCFVHELIAITHDHTAHSPTLWGCVAHLEQLFGTAAASISAAEREFVFRYRSPLHWIEVFRSYYGPLHRAFAALDARGQAALTAKLVDLLEQHNRSRDRTLVLPCAYLEAVIEKR